MSDQIGQIAPDEMGANVLVGRKPQLKSMTGTDRALPRTEALDIRFIRIESADIAAQCPVYLGEDSLTRLLHRFPSKSFQWFS